MPNHNMPIPVDSALALPVPEPILVILLVVSFLAHIVFVNMMVGGVLLTFYYQIKGLKDKKWDHFAHEIAQTTSVNKSMAVVLGVAPLLTINALYSIYFYTSMSLTGYAWVAIIPLVTVAFALVYLHKYTWDYFANKRVMHIAILFLAVLCFLFIPLIFLSNVHLMASPELWTSIHGFLSSLTQWVIWPRYVLFILLCLTVSGLFLFAYFGRQKEIFEENPELPTQQEIQIRGLKLAFYTLLAQIILSPLMLMAANSRGLSSLFFVILGLGGLFAIGVLIALYKNIYHSPLKFLHMKKVWILSLFCLVALGAARQEFRRASLEEHREAVRIKSESFYKKSEQAWAEAQALKALAKPPLELGKDVYEQNCSACHALDSKVVGPSMKEGLKPYVGKVAELQKWIETPGKKDPSLPQMPGFPSLSEEEMSGLLEYLQSLK